MKTAVSTTEDKQSQYVSLERQRRDSLALAVSLGVGRHQLPRNLLPLHRLVMIIFIVDNRDIGLFAYEILERLEAAGQRVTAPQLAYELYRMKKAGLLQSSRLPDCGNNHFYWPTNKLHLTQKAYGD